MVTVIRDFTVILICMILFGCDPTFSPYIRNEYPREIELIDFKNDGEKSSVFIPSCIGVSVGPIDQQRGVLGSSRLVIKWKGEVIHDFSKEDLRKLLEKQVDYDGYSVWIVNPSGVHFSEERTCSLEKKKE
jgi:hypothetical protein